MPVSCVNAMKKLNLLILHAMGPKSRWFAGVADVELMFPQYAVGHNCLVHNAYYRLPAFIRDIPFDAVIIMSTFMDKITGQGLDGTWTRQYDFLKSHKAVKIVFPQDDYWLSEVRDQFYLDWNIAEVFPISPASAWPDLLPRYLSAGKKISQGYTTYVTDFMRRAGKTLCKHHDERQYDVVYRASQRPNYPNHLGYVKGVLGNRFLDAVGKDNKLAVNISVNPKDLIRGDDWLAFVASSRAVLGSNSGSSIRIRNHDTALAVKRLWAANPGMTISEMETRTIPEEDRRKFYTCISPRNVEAAMLETLQILVPGPYSNILEPYEHYVPIQEDCSNIDEVLAMLADHRRCETIAKQCKRRILECKELQVESIMACAFNTVFDLRDFRESSMSPDVFVQYMERHKTSLRRSEMIDGPYRMILTAARKIIPAHWRIFAAYQWRRR
jgi:hypothetical protein